jgi:hypothetical protein
VLGWLTAHARTTVSPTNQLLARATCLSVDLKSLFLCRFVLPRGFSVRTLSGFTCIVVSTCIF